jgi:predicted nuclease with TOPRIM domain
MILTIDKSKELTRKEYVDFLQKTRGETISESRISQLVSAGKLKVRDYPELGNLQLIVLDDDEQALAQARFSTSQAIHTYSYKELGLMVGKLIHDVTNENGNAQTLLNEKQSQLDQLVSTLQHTEADRDEARQTVRKLTGYQQQIEAENESLQTALAQRTEQVATLQSELKSLTETLTDTQRKLDIETSFRGEFDSFKSLVMNLIQKQADDVQTATIADVAKPASGKRGKESKA